MLWERLHLCSGEPVSSLQRKTPLKKVNPARRRRLWKRNFNAKSLWIRTLPCIVCVYPVTAEAVHVRARGMGGCNGSSKDMVPMCRTHHVLLDDTLGSPARFTEATGIDLVAAAAHLEAEWLEDRA